MFVSFQNHNKIYSVKRRLETYFVQKKLNNQTEELSDKKLEQNLSHIITKLDILNKSIIELATIYL